MYLYKKNIILVPTDYDGISLAKGILTFDCYSNKTTCHLRTYNLDAKQNLILGVAINKKLNKIKLDEKKLQNQSFELDQVLSNTDKISVVLLKVDGTRYEIYLWGSTELNSSWRSTLEFMLEKEYNVQSKNKTFEEQTTETLKESKSQQTSLFDTDFFESVEKSKVNDGADVLSSEKVFEKIDDISKDESIENFAQDDCQCQNQTQILQNCNLEDFLDHVINMEESQDEAFYDPNIDQNSEQNIEQSETFYDRISYQIDKMFISNPEEKILDEIIPNSKFCRVEFDDKTGHYVFGIVYEQEKPKYLCYGVPAKKGSLPPKELSSYYQWLPIDVEDQDGDGYYMMYQEAETGKNISIEIVWLLWQ